MKDYIITGFENNDWRFDSKSELEKEQEYIFKRNYDNSCVTATFYYPQKELLIEDAPAYTQTISTLFNGKLRSLADLKVLNELLFV